MFPTATQWRIYELCIALIGGAVFKKVTNGLSHVTCILTLSETQLGTSGAGFSL